MYLTHSSWETLAIFLNLHILIPRCGGHVCVGYCAPPPHTHKAISQLFSQPLSLTCQNWPTCLPRWHIWGGREGWGLQGNRTEVLCACLEEVEFSAITQFGVGKEKTQELFFTSHHSQQGYACSWEKSHSRPSWDFSSLGLACLPLFPLCLPRKKKRRKKIKSAE